MKNDITTKRVNTTEHTRRYSETEIRDLLVSDLFRRAPPMQGQHAHKVTIGTSQKVGEAAEYFATVTISVDHEPVAEDLVMADPSPLPSDPRPPQCRERLRSEGRPHPKSSCLACTGFLAHGCGAPNGINLRK